MVSTQLLEIVAGGALPLYFFREILPSELYRNGKHTNGGEKVQPLPAVLPLYQESGHGDCGYFILFGLSVFISP